MKRLFLTFLLLIFFTFSASAQVKRNLVIVQVDTIVEVSDVKYTRSKPVIYCIENDSFYRWSMNTNGYVLFNSGGLQGEKGDKGDKGDTGASGLNGANGTNGTNGAKGDTGLQGVKGDSGTNGTNGINGTNGTTPTDAQLLTLFSANDYRKIYAIQQTQTLPLIALGATYNFNVNLTGVSSGMVCIVNVDSLILDALANYDCKVTGNGVLNVRLKSLVAITAGNKIFEIRVIQ